ncbi:hypothetical protein LBMAG42_53940 [Deltaproteobacteria bacterium]|nr:hypothetical protein LBMAG42_53940 [Deltaproteobacteria bacterium]
MTLSVPNRRVAQLLAVSAIAEQRPLGAVLRSCAGAGRAASLADAGRLGAALEALGLPHEVVATALHWPAATARVARAVDALPLPWTRGATVAVALAWPLGVGLLQTVVLVVLSTKVAPQLDEVLQSGAWHAGRIQLALAAVEVNVAACLAAIGAVLGAPRFLGRVLGWGRPDAAARRAAWRAGLLEGGTPADVLVRLLGAEDSGALPPRHVADRALAQAERAEARAAACARIGGLVGLLLVGALTLLTIYGAIARLPGLAQ